MMPPCRFSNIVLIGMAGVGKSTTGVLLAKALSLEFVDTDVLIQAREGRLLQEMIDTEGIGSFLALEERHVLGCDFRNSVIATGGSVVYSEPAMGHLRAGSFSIHLRLPLPALEQRLSDINSRGLVIAPGQTIRNLYMERQPLYQRHADVTVDCEGLATDKVVGRLMDVIQRHLPGLAARGK